MRSGAKRHALVAPPASPAQPHAAGSSARVRCPGVAARLPQGAVPVPPPPARRPSFTPNPRLLRAPPCATRSAPIVLTGRLASQAPEAADFLRSSTTGWLPLPRPAPPAWPHAQRRAAAPHSKPRPLRPPRRRHCPAARCWRAPPPPWCPSRAHRPLAPASLGEGLGGGLGWLGLHGHSACGMGPGLPRGRPTLPDVPPTDPPHPAVPSLPPRPPPAPQLRREHGRPQAR